jgi:hypothetical protein
MARIQGLPGRPSSILIIAHPGHELLVHHWLERARPKVFILTDGSGSADNDRSQQSRRTIENAGASCGHVFAAASDRDWYDDLLAGDVRRFLTVIERIVLECGSGADEIVCDRVELFNPMHDLANVVAHSVANLLAEKARNGPTVKTFPIEAPDEFPHIMHSAAPLPAAALARKQRAISDYRALALEAPRYDRLVGCEPIIYDEPAFTWPPAPPCKPYYERFGERRVRGGLYNRLITYQSHVRPMAVRLLDGR